MMDQGTPGDGDPMARILQKTARNLITYAVKGLKYQ